MSGCWQVDKIRGNCQFWYYHIYWVILVSNGASCIYRRFWHILRIFFQYLYESRYFDHSCTILCVVPYASEKFGQIWTKMIEEAMMRLFLRKKLLKGEILTGSKNQNLLDTTIRSCLFHFLATWISFNCPIVRKKKFENDLQFWNYFQIIVYFQDWEEWWHGWHIWSQETLIKTQIMCKWIHFQSIIHF